MSRMQGPGTGGDYYCAVLCCTARTTTVAVTIGPRLPD